MSNGSQGYILDCLEMICLVYNNSAKVNIKSYLNSTINLFYHSISETIAKVLLF